MEPKKDTNSVQRPPVVVVVGHVDHGKTSLLDYIRKTNVVRGEAGGITQSVGAYEILHNGKRITFIDTPGHEAFGKMRSRGAKIADLAILVIAADEGVKPQTEESIKILNESATPFVVAITKVDKPTANLEKIKNELLTAGVLLEGYGGNISYEAVSVISGDGINKLLDLILLLGEFEQLSYDPEAVAHGYILESNKDSRRGVTANVILKNGTLKEGDAIATKSSSGKIKSLENFLGERSKTLTPSAPASILGFGALPEVGEEFLAGNINIEEIRLEVAKKVNPDSRDDDEKKLNAFIVADTSGSLEVLKQLTEKFINMKGSAAGEITDNDIQNAISTESVLVGFKVKISKSAENLARIHSIKIFSSDIIYKLVEELESYLKEKIGPEINGSLQVLKIFGGVDNRQIIGGKVIDGLVKNGSEIQIIRGDKILGIGKIVNLQEGKKDISEVVAGNECGILIDSDVKISPRDIIKSLV